MQVDDGEEKGGGGGRGVLEVHPLAEGAEVVA